MTGKTPLKHSILIVDDEPEILFSIKGLLRREFNLYTAESGAEALEILREHPIHVVMTDQRMPEMTGVEFIGKVKSEYPDAIRMVFTGYADIKAVIDAINKGGLFRYITKPWDPDELVDVLREAAAEYDRLVERRRLLADLKEHLGQGQDYAKRLVGQTTEAKAVNQYLENATQLLTRLQQQR